MKKIRFISMIVSSGVFVLACNQNPAGQPEEILVDTDAGVDTTAELPEPGLNFDPPVIYVKTDTSEIVRILNETVYHGDEVWEDAETGTWYGLYTGESGFFIEETSIRAERVHDAIVDEDESIKTGWEITDANPGSSLILMNGVEMEQRNVESVDLSATEIFPGDTIAFEYAGITYQLYASGNNKVNEYNPDYYFIENYKLFLKAEKNGAVINQQLVEHASFDEAMVTILFAGDLDGDNIPDMLIDNARHYNVMCPTLYLSSGSAANALLQIVGWQYSVGC